MTTSTDRRVSEADPVLVAVITRVDDHEGRMRAQEKFRYAVSGALAMLAFLFPTTVGAVAAVLANR